MNKIVLGGGCFWCVEAVLKELEGVEEAVSGYAGGETADPSYKEVCKGDTGHAEVVKIRFNPEILGLKELLEKFFTIHNPTTRNRQGPDKGSQYRSIILYQDQEQKEVIDNVIEKVKTNYRDSIVTEVMKLENFYKAEERHQDYFAKNPEDAYCRLHIPDKIDKVKS